jgi:hypothetical protein
MSLYLKKFCQSYFLFYGPIQFPKGITYKHLSVFGPIYSP